MLRVPAARARWQISAAGNASAVGLVMWLRKMILVRGVTALHRRFAKASWLVAGSGIG
jgi:hypothetical protein